MQRFMSVADALVGMVYHHLPSPITAQRYRASWLYAGDVTDAVGSSIARCDPSGPTVMFVSKMVPMPKSKSFYAYGRVFSGTVRPGMKVWVYGSGDDGTCNANELPGRCCHCSRTRRSNRLLTVKAAAAASVFPGRC